MWYKYIQDTFIETPKITQTGKSRMVLHVAMNEINKSQRFSFQKIPVRGS